MDQKPELPSREELRPVVEWLHMGEAGAWSRAEWQSWMTHAYEWCYRTTRGLLIALNWIERLERKVATLELRIRSLEAELAQARTRRSGPPPVPPSSYPSGPPSLPAQSPISVPSPAPPTPEARALSAFARRPMSDAERDRKRRFMERAEDLFMEISNFEAVEGIVIENAEEEDEEDTVFMPTDEP